MNPRSNALLILLLALLAGGAEARQVPVGPPTESAPDVLTAALADAEPGDSLMIAPGFYPGALTLKSGVSLIGVAGPESTVLDADGERYVLFGRHVDSTTMISGLTLQNGRRDHPNSGGGGIYLHRSSPLVINNVFRDHLGYLGPGVYMSYECRAVVAFNVFHRSEGYLGGAVASYQDCAPLIYNNILYDNRAVSGGAILILNSAPVILRNTVVGNEASQGGGAVYIDSSPALIEENVFAHNVKDGAVYSLDDDRPATFRNNLVWDNVGGAHGGLGADFVDRDGNCRGDPRFRDRDNGDYLRSALPDDCAPDAGARSWNQAVTPRVPPEVLAGWRAWIAANKIP